MFVKLQFGGRELCLLVGLVYGTPYRAEQSQQDPVGYVVNFERSVAKIHEIARGNILKAADKQKRGYHT